MEFNVTGLESNVTVNDLTKFFHINISNLTNQSEKTQHLFDLYEAYRTKEKEQLMMYKLVAYIIGTLIILSNLTVVISSGLILKKGQQPKSTYLLLGNVSLADTIIGFSIIFGAIVDNTMNSNPLCIFQIGMLVCPAMVSIFSVGMIAVDRYIYILHGMYYQRWFTTTKVRIIILCIWLIGATLGFMPATGLVNRETKHCIRCDYVVLFPGSLILINSIFSTIPILVVVGLYSIILVKALSNVKKIKAADKYDKIQINETPKLRINRANANAKTMTTVYNIKSPKNDVTKLKRSASYSVNLNNIDKSNGRPKSKSIDDLTNGNHKPTNDYNNDVTRTQYDSKYSVCTVETSCSDSYSPSKNYLDKYYKKEKRKKPNKWRAITVVMLTSGSFVCTWLPFFVIVIFYALCEEKLTNPQCVHYRTLQAGPMAMLAFVNSILNPLIYAWWHKGFQRSVIIYFRKYCCRKIKQFSSSES